MAGEQSKTLSELQTKGHAEAGDKLVIVDTSNTANVWTKTIKVEDFLANSSVAQNLRLANSFTPANSTISVLRGEVFFDSDYLYVATANNTLKRVSLQSF